MRKVILAACLVVALSACKPHTLGPVQSEDGEVAALSYMPSNHGTGVGYAFTGGRSGGGVAVTSVTIPEKWAVVFRCTHGSFVIDDWRAKELFTRLRQGQAVRIDYQIEYEGEPGKEIPVDLHFVGAVPR